MYLLAKMYFRIRFDCRTHLHVNTYQCWHNANNSFQTKSYLKSKSKLNLILQPTLVAFLKGFHDIFLCHKTNTQTCFYWYFNIDRFYLWMICETHSCLFSFKPLLLLIFTSKKADVWNLVHYLSPKDDISKENNIKVKT